MQSRAYTVSHLRSAAWISSDFARVTATPAGANSGGRKISVERRSLQHESCWREAIWQTGQTELPPGSATSLNRRQDGEIADVDKSIDRLLAVVSRVSGWPPLSTMLHSDI